MEASKKLTIIHFNDVYELRSKEGGAGKFCHAVNEYRKAHDALVLFSGDCFSPAKLSIAKKGEHMPYVLNNIKTTVACVGNHDLAS